MSGRIVVMPGATGRLGEAVARAFLEAGDTVVVSGRSRDRLDALRTLLGAGDRVDVAAFDSVQPDGASALAEDIANRHGRIDCLVHLIGTFSMATVVDAPPDVWTQMLTVNALSAAYLLKAVLPGMLARGYGKAAFVSSLAVPSPPAGLAPYAASKAALEAIVKASAQEVKGRGVNVNAAAITTLDSPESRKWTPDIDPSRMIAPEDLAQTLLFLCSDAASAINGAVIPVLGTASIQVTL